MSAAMLLWPLGTVGWIPTGYRETPAFLVESGEQLILLDAGTGIRRLAGQAVSKILDRHDTVNILLSHYHADHIFGFTFFPLFLFGKNVTVHGPGPTISGTSTVKALNRFLGTPIFPLPFERFPMDLEIRDLEEGEIRVGETKVLVRQQHHSDPTIGIRIDDALCYITDTHCEEETVEFARGAKVLLHECWLDAADTEAMVTGTGGIPEPPDVLKMHSHAEGVAEIAREAGVERLGLIHLNPRYDEHRCRRMARDCKRIFPGTFLVNDDEPIRID